MKLITNDLFPKKLLMLNEKVINISQSYDDTTHKIVIVVITNKGRIFGMYFQEGEIVNWKELPLPPFCRADI